MLKIAEIIISLHEKGDRTISTYYHPISLLPHISEIFETLIYRRLIE